jgi:hypothetical protein
MRGGPLGGGGGGVGVALAEPYGGAGGGIDRFCWFGNGLVMAEESGVLRRAVGGLTTIGVSFHCTISLALEGGGTDGVVFRGGGGPNEVGGGP